MLASVQVFLRRVQNGLRRYFFVHRPTSTAHTILLSSMARSGSTWIASLLNSSKTHREIFEPFLPMRVPEAKAFEYMQYISPDENNPPCFRSAQRILEGRLGRQRWLDRGNRVFFSNKRLVKDIRTNLMLGWLHRNFPEMKIVFLIRNPFSVVQSFMDLGWGLEPSGVRREIDILMSQEKLLMDFPLIRENSTNVDLTNYFESLLFQWCILNYVPLQQINKSKIHVTYYENYMIDPKAELEELYSFLRQPIDNRVFDDLKIPSWTSYQKKHFSISNVKLEPTQLARGKKILELFSLDNLYNDDFHPVKNMKAIIL